VTVVLTSAECRLGQRLERGARSRGRRQEGASSQASQEGRHIQPTGPVVVRYLRSNNFPHVGRSHTVRDRVLHGRDTLVGQVDSSCRRRRFRTVCRFSCTRNEIVYNRSRQA